MVAGEGLSGNFRSRRSDRTVPQSAIVLRFSADEAKKSLLIWSWLASYAPCAIANWWSAGRDRGACAANGGGHADAAIRRANNAVALARAERRRLEGMPRRAWLKASIFGNVPEIFHIHACWGHLPPLRVPNELASAIAGPPRRNFEPL